MTQYLIQLVYKEHVELTAISHDCESPSQAVHCAIGNIVYAELNKCQKNSVLPTICAEDMTLSIYRVVEKLQGRGVHIKVVPLDPANVNHTMYLGCTNFVKAKEFIQEKNLAQ